MLLMVMAQENASLCMIFSCDMPRLCRHNLGAKSFIPGPHGFKLWLQAPTAESQSISSGKQSLV